MTTANMNIVFLHIVANTEEQALRSVRFLNKSNYNGEFSYFLVEQLKSNEWRGILAHSEDEALQAQKEFHKEKQD